MSYDYRMLNFDLVYRPNFHQDRLKNHLSGLAFDELDLDLEIKENVDINIEESVDNNSILKIIASYEPLNSSAVINCLEKLYVYEDLDEVFNELIITSFEDIDKLCFIILSIPSLLNSKIWEQFATLINHWTFELLSYCFSILIPDIELYSSDVKHSIIDFYIEKMLDFDPLFEETQEYDDLTSYQLGLD